MKIKYEIIDSLGTPIFSKINAILEKSFIADERREYTPLLLQHPNFQLNAIFDNEICIGMLACWKFKDFIFIEHFAIDDLFRNKGFGENILRDFFVKNPQHIIIMEAERDTTDIARRRLSFYQRLGMKINPFDYIQPPYSPTKSSVPMTMVSYPRALNSMQYDNIKKIIYAEVYGLN